MNDRWKEFQTAWMLLTRLPGGTLRDPIPTTGQAAWAFPLVGAILGLAMWAVFALCTALGLPPLTAAIAALAAQALMTGGLHEDGLADTADGFGGGQTVERKLDIMRDSRIGSYGVLALILTIGLTVTSMAPAASFWTFLAIAAASRTAMLLPMILLPPARTQGLGHAASLTWDKGVMTALILTALLALTTLGPVIAIGGTAIALMALCKRQIGGQTGDTLGATQKLTECTGWLVAAALYA